MKVIVHVTKDDLENSSYYDNRNCAVAKALRRVFPEGAVTVGGSRFKIDDVWYDMPLRAANELVRFLVFTTKPARAFWFTFDYQEPCLNSTPRKMVYMLYTRSYRATSPTRRGGW